MGSKLLIVDVAALGYEFLCAAGGQRWRGLEFRPAQSVFPSVTCTVQGSFRTAANPASHGMVANGLYFRELRRPMFWEQSSALVAGPRIWEGLSNRGGRVGMLFWQQSLGEDADVLLSPAPIHKHHGGMIQDCYSRPAGLYDQLCQRLGRRFNLMRYWGPMASAKVGDWIAAAAAAVMEDAAVAPDLCLVYLPSLDYELQRRGPAHAKARAAWERTVSQLDLLAAAAERAGYEMLIFGDYAIAPCSRAAMPNRALLEAGLMSVRDVRGMLYPDFHASRAFAVVDHEVAHVYVPDAADVPAVRDVLARLDGVAEVLDRPAQRQLGLDHPNSGELVLVAAQGAWLGYPWWTDKRRRPDYATHVDIHSKPGYDPCELFFGWPPPSVSQNPARIRGSHGRTGPGREVAWASTLSIPSNAGTIVDLALFVKSWLDEVR